MIKMRVSSVVLIIAGIIALIMAVQYLLPTFAIPPQPKPEPIVEEKKYEYYTLINEENGEVLGYVSSVRVTTGDEYISENNTRYVVTRVEENRAYLHSFGPTDGGKEKGKFKDKTN